MERWEQIIETVELPRPDQKVYIWGAGNTSVLNHQGMLRENLYPEFHVYAYLDANKAGTFLFDKPVYSPEILNTENPLNVFVLISTTNRKVFQEIKNDCIARGISCCLMDAAILKIRRSEFISTSELLDECSQRIYFELLANRATATEPDALYAGESYFGIPEFCRANPHDVIVDCGAYVGDSAERYIWRMEQFKRYVAIEPDLGNYRALQKRFARLKNEWNFPDGKLQILYGGADECSSVMGVETRVDGLGSIAKQPSDESSPVQFWAIDDLMIEGFTFLKADIESYEYRMLCGAKTSISSYHPRMAICIYHNMIDMFSIPQLIHQIDPTYRLAIRHHSYGYEETVLYAY